MNDIVCISPVAGHEVARRPNATDAEIAAALAQARQARQDWSTVMNRCDHVDPSLAWTGVKDTARGVGMSRLGFEALTWPKSFHLRIEH